jgi:hypothetical protein
MRFAKTGIQDIAPCPELPPFPNPDGDKLTNIVLSMKRP